MKRHQFHSVPQYSHVQPAIFVRRPSSQECIKVMPRKGMKQQYGKALTPPSGLWRLCAFSTPVKIRFAVCGTFSIIYL